MGQRELFDFDLQDDDSDIQNQQMRKRMMSLYESVSTFGWVVVVLLLVFTFCVRNATVKGSSMVPTLINGERLILQQIGYDDPQYGDIVVIDRTQDYDQPLIKRVIGRPGDTIDIDFDTHEVFRNGELLDEPYINEPTAVTGDMQFPAVVPEGCVFVMGDNRNHSSDSRDMTIGMIDQRNIMGKAIFRFFPFGKFGKL